MADLMGIAQTGLRAAYAQLQTTGHNISNVNTPGYVRQAVTLESAGGQYSGHGTIGRGVAVVDVRRQYDEFLTRDLRSSQSLASGDQARRTGLERLDRTVADTQNGLGVVIDEFRDALADVVNQPGVPATRTAALARADSLANRFTTLDSRLADLDTTTVERVRDTVGQTNAQLEQIASLNQRIASQAGSDTRALDLVDQRDRLIKDVSGAMQVATVRQEDGSINVFSASGLALVMSNRASRLEVAEDPRNPSQLQLTVNAAAGAGAGTGAPVPMQRNDIGAGSIAAQLQFRDVDLASARAQLGQLAGALAGAYNAQQALGLDAAGKPGTDLFAAGAPQSRAALANKGTGTLQVSVTDPSALRASDYSLRFQDGRYSVERLSDGTITEAAGGPIAVDGLRIELPAQAMAEGDSFAVMAASRMGGGMRRVLASPQGLAAAAAGATDPAADNGNARAMVALGDRPLVGGTATFNGAFASLVADVGTRAARAQSAAEASQTVLTNAEAAVDEKSGVNLDEEAARLLQYQQAYQASARVLATAQSMFSTVLDAVSGR